MSTIVTAEQENPGKEKVPRLSEKKEKRQRVIRIREWTYQELMNRGKMGDDFDDVITELLEGTKGND